MLLSVSSFHCRYEKKGKCLRADMDCNPNHVKCANNYKHHMYCFYYESPEHKHRISHREREIIHGDEPVFDLYDEVPELYVYSGTLFISCEDLLDCIIVVRDVVTNAKCIVLVAKDKRNGKLYISKTQVDERLRKHEFLNVRFCYCGYSECSEAIWNSKFCMGYSPFSVLALHGYKVGEKGVDENKRHIILRHVIDNGIMRGTGIIKLLQQNIRQAENKSGNYHRAISDWRKDLMFVNDYCGGIYWYMV